MCTGLGFHFTASPVPGVRSNPVGHSEVWQGASPPFVSSMTEAVLDIIASKFGPSGSYGADGRRPWRGGAGQPVAPHGERAVEAAIAFCEYVFATYGRFPAHEDAFKTLVAFQAHHVDMEFYDTFYPKHSLQQAHREHGAVWHSAEEWTYEDEVVARKEGVQ